MSKLRVEKIQELIKQEISNMIIRDVKDPRVKNVTVTSVEASGDLKYAKIFVSIYGTKEQQTEAWAGLNKAIGFMRSELAKRISLRVAPILSLHRDTSIEYSAHIEELLNQLKKEEEHHE